MSEVKYPEIANRNVSKGQGHKPSEEIKTICVECLLLGEDVPVLAERSGVQKNTLYRWKKEALKAGKSAEPDIDYESLDRKRFIELCKMITDIEEKAPLLDKLKKQRDALAIMLEE